MIPHFKPFFLGSCTWKISQMVLLPNINSYKVNKIGHQNFICKCWSSTQVLSLCYCKAAIIVLRHVLSFTKTNRKLLSNINKWINN